MSFSSSTTANRMDPFLSMFAQKIKIPVKRLEFWYFNSKVSPGDTIETLDCSNTRYRFRIEVTRVNRRHLRDDHPPMIIRFRGMTGEETLLETKADCQMCHPFAAYAEWKGIESSSSLRFSLDGEKVHPWETPRMVELQDYDSVLVMWSLTAC